MSSSKQPLERAQLLSLSTDCFRNLSGGKLSPAARLNLISGANGHGKTSLIEALYVVCTSKSFRASLLKEVIQTDSSQARIKAEVRCFDVRRELTASISTRGRSFLVDQKKPKRAYDYATLVPIVAFHPGELHLASGAAAGRRRLLDRIIIYRDPIGAEARLRYQQALKDRMHLLQSGDYQSPELDVYEELASRYGSRFSLARRHAAEHLSQELDLSFTEIASSDLELSAQYQGAGSEDPEKFFIELKKRRQVDGIRKRTSFGPQKDELELFLEGRPVRQYASQGQQRLLALAMKMGELAVIRDVVGIEPILLLDDVSSELDSARTEAVFSYLRQRRNQIFVTTTRPELFEDLLSQEEERARYRLDAGDIVEL